MTSTTAERKKRNEKQKPNTINLTADQRLGLHFQYVDKIETLEEEAAAANGRLRAARKAAKSELGEEGLKEIDDAIYLSTPEGEAELRAEQERRIRVAAWHGVELAGGQASLLAALPARDFKNEGKLAGLRGLTAKPPDGLSQVDSQAWLEGWHVGQAVLVEGFGRTNILDPETHEQKVARETRAAEKAIANPKPADPANDEDLRPDYAKPETQEHPDEARLRAKREAEKATDAPAMGSAPSTIKKLH